MQSVSSHSTRRDFLKTWTGFAIGTSLVSTLAVPRAVHADVGKTVRVGLIGCGGSGRREDAFAFVANTNHVLTAIDDEAGQLLLVQRGDKGRHTKRHTAAAG